MADTVVGGVDDGLVVTDNVRVIAIQVSNPPQRLRWRSNVIAVRAEHHNRSTDVTQVDALSIGSQQFGSSQLVADKQIVDDILHFYIIEKNVASPIFFEFQ